MNCTTRRKVSVVVALLANVLLITSEAAAVPSAQSGQQRFQKRGRIVTGNHASFTKPMIELTGLPQSKVQLGSTVRIVCEAFAAPVTTLSWTFNGRPINDLENRSPWNKLSQLYELEEGYNRKIGADFYQVTDVHSSLEISCFNSENQGTYGCTATTASGMSETVNATISLSEDNLEEPSNNAADSCLLEKLANPHTFIPKAQLWAARRLENEDCFVILPCRSSLAGERPVWFREFNNETRVPVDNSETEVLESGDLLLTPGVDCTVGGCMFHCVLGGQKHDSFVYEVVKSNDRRFHG